MKPVEMDLGQFTFLQKAALELGAIDAKVILASDVFVENRVPLKCRTDGICVHPSMARIPEHAVGVNMKKTAENADMAIQFPVSGNPTPMAMLLID
jgi:predicted metal-binding protein